MKSFLEMLGFAVLGLLAGLVLGFGFGTLIAYVTSLIGGEFSEEFPIGLGSFLGMGFGSVIGGVVGVVFGYKK